VAQLVELEGPDLLLLDLMMPGTSGFELRRVLSDQVEVRPPLVLDGLTINFVQRRVTVNGQPVSLSATEYKILYELASHAGMVLTHGQILQRV
jgi:two-component system KDP operon response regulator KdpE